MGILKWNAVYRIRDFYEVMNIVFILQYFTVSLPSCSIRPDKTLVVHPKTAFVELCFACLMAIPHIIVVVFLLSSKFSITVFQVLFFAVNLSSLIFSLINAYQMKIKVEKLKSVFEKIKSLDKFITVNTKQLKCLNIKLGFWSFGLIFTILVTLVSALVRTDTLIMKIIMFIATLRVHVLPAVSLMQFMVLITMVRYYFEWVDRELGKIKHWNEKGNSNCVVISNFRPHFGEAEDCKTACKIEKLRKLYGKVHDLKREVNDTYAITLWIDIGASIIQVLFFVYANVIIFQKDWTTLQKNLVVSVHYLIFWTTMITLKFVQNVSVCGRVAESGKNIGITVHHLFSRSYCDSVRQELTTFSLELLHRDPYIKAYKFFVIDYPLTAGVVRGLIMQLIALMQINIPEPDDSTDLINFMSPSEQHPGHKNLTFPQTN